MFPGRYAFKARLKSDCRLTLRAMRKHRVHYLFMLPYLLLFTLFTILPVIVAVLLSFTSFNMLSAPEFIGVDNYFRLFLNDDIFIIALKNTLLFAVIVGPGGFLLSFFFAWLINELSHNMRVFFTIIFYAPSISGGIYIIWNYLFSGDAQGYVNSILRKLGIIQTPIQFFQNPDYMFPILIVIILWMSLGTSFLVFIAGFQGVDKQYYEAAALDGISNPLAGALVCDPAHDEAAASALRGAQHYRFVRSRRRNNEPLRFPEHELRGSYDNEPSVGLRHYAVRNGICLYACDDTVPYDDFLQFGYT